MVWHKAQDFSVRTDASACLHQNKTSVSEWIQRFCLYTQSLIDDIKLCADQTCRAAFRGILPEGEMSAVNIIR